MDERRREVERLAQGGDLDAAARALVHKVRSGETTPGCVQMLAFLGDDAARHSLGEHGYVKHEWPKGRSHIAIRDRGETRTLYDGPLGPREDIMAWCKSAVLLAHNEKISTRMFAARAWLAVGSKLAKEEDHDLSTLDGGDKPCLTCCGCHEDICPVPDLWAVSAWVRDPTHPKAKEVCAKRWDMNLRAGSMTVPSSRGFLDPVGCYIVSGASDYLKQFGQQWTGIDVNLGSGFAEVATSRTPQWVVETIREGVTPWLMEGAPDPRPMAERCGHNTIERVNLDAIDRRDDHYPESMVRRASPWKAGPMVCLDCGRELAPAVGAVAFEGQMRVVGREVGRITVRVHRDVVEAAREAGGDEITIASRLRRLIEDQLNREGVHDAGEIEAQVEFGGDNPRWMTFELGVR